MDTKLIEELKQETEQFLQKQDIQIGEVYQWINKLQSVRDDCDNADGELHDLIGKLQQLKNTIQLADPNYKPPIKKRIEGVTDKKSYWTPVGDGHIKIGHRPGGKSLSFERLKEEKVDAVLTILGKKEGAMKIGKQVLNYGMDWAWIQLRDGKIPALSSHPHIIKRISAENFFR